MKNYTSLYGFCVSMIFLWLPNMVAVAQHQGTVGVNVILKPIQTILVDSRGYENRATPQMGIHIDEKQNQQVNAFGTTGYGVTVNSSIAVTDPLARISKGLSFSNGHDHAMIGTGSEPEGQASRTSLRTTVVYSIQVD